jgi:glutathione-regulated potassium-efflux system ancillary protein KefF
MSKPNVALIYAHPYAERSLANRELLKAVEDLSFVDRRPLYDLYPDFDIDADAEREQLAKADLIVLQHPVYWYSMPALLKLWIDEVLSIGWAYGDGGRALHGKRFLWVVTTGADFRAYAPEGPHGHPFEVFTAPMKQTARFCGMEWLEPIVVHDAHADQAQVAACGALYRERMLAFAPKPKAEPKGASMPAESAAVLDAAS